MNAKMAGRQPVVLIADDEEAITFSLAREVTRLGGIPLVAADGLGAVTQFEQQQGQVDAVFMDVRMPRLDGVAALARIRQLAPNIRCCLMTAFDPAQLANEVGATPILAKPFDLDEFRRKLAALLGTDNIHSTRDCVRDVSVLPGAAA